MERAPFTVYVGRAGHGHDGYFGNPIHLTPGEPKGVTLARFSAYMLDRIRTDAEYSRRVRALRGQTLGCFCAPPGGLPPAALGAVCHAQILAAFAEANPVAVISGGQTGADQGALRGAAETGLTTGGWAPHGWKTQDGSAPWLGAHFGLREHAFGGYAVRTIANVEAGDATLVIGRTDSPGCRLTLGAVKRHNKPVHTVAFPWASPPVGAVRAWLMAERPTVLNVAGNREHTNRGIHEATRAFMRAVLAPE